MADLDLDELKRLFNASAVVGDALQRNGQISPSQALAVLVITAGRLLAREAHADIDADDAWEVVTACRRLFKWGHDEERHAGHLGVPRG